MLPRRALLAAALLPGLPAMSARAEPASTLSFFAAVVRAKAADAAFRASGVLSHSNRAPGGSLTPEWRAHRWALRDARATARADLQAMTPATTAEADALVSYYADRAAGAGTASAARLARRHLREIFARTGAAQPSGRLPSPLASAADPIFAAIDAVRSTERAFTTSLRDLDEDDAEAVRRADEAGEANDRAVAALYALMPATVAGLHALIRHYAKDAEAFEPGTAGTLNLAHLARIVASNAPS